MKPSSDTIYSMKPLSDVIDSIIDTEIAPRISEREYRIFIPEKEFFRSDIPFGYKIRTFANILLNEECLGSQVVIEAFSAFMHGATYVIITPTDNIVFYK